MHPFNPVASAPLPGFDVTALAAFDLDLRASAGTVTLGSLAIENIAASLRTSRTGVRIDVGDARALDGSLTASLSASADGSTMSRVGLSNASLDTQRLGTDGVSLVGTGSLDLTMTSRGEERSGHGRLRLQPGTLRGMDLPAVMAGGAPSGSTDLRSLDARFTLADGRLTLDDARLATPNFDATISGHLRLDKPVPLNLGLDARQRSRPDAVRSIGIGGTLDAPELDVATSRKAAAGN